MHYSQENNYMAVAFSRDGIDFSTPQPWPKYNPPADTHNFVFMDPKTNRYVLVTRVWKDGIRIAAKSESSDFLTWTEPEEIARGIGFENQVYSMPVFSMKDCILDSLRSITTATDQQEILTP